jgi:hypothetical protein
LGLLDVILGRTKPARPDLDRLFGLPSAQITLEASEALYPTGQAGVCFKPAAGQDFAATEREFESMLVPDEAGSPEEGAIKLDESTDEYGYRWVVVGSGDFQTLVTRVHFVNSTLQDNGYGPQLLCSVFGFSQKAADGTPAPASTYLVYLYKRGSFYPFVPTGEEKRDNEAELRLKNEISGDLRIESDLDHWFPIWKLPVH